MRVCSSVIECSHCGLLFEPEIKLSCYSDDFGLDGKPVTPNFLPDILECPRCHYAGHKIDGKAPNLPSDLIVNTDDPYDIYERALICSPTDKDKLDILCEFVWKCEYDGDYEKARAIRERAVILMESMLSKEPIIELAFIYLEFLRLLSRFAEAESVLKSVSQKVVDDMESHPMFYRLYVYEQHLLTIRDNEPHFISEIKE